MYGNKKAVGFTPYSKEQGFSPTLYNDATIRIITRADIEELVKLIDK